VVLARVKGFTGGGSTGKVEKGSIGGQPRLGEGGEPAADSLIRQAGILPMPHSLNLAFIFSFVLKTWPFTHGYEDGGFQLDS
jgi:hypothetical protein